MLKDQKYPTKTPSMCFKRTIIDPINFVFLKNSQKKFYLFFVKKYFFFSFQKIARFKNAV